VGGVGRRREGAQATGRLFARKARGAFHGPASAGTFHGPALPARAVVSDDGCVSPETSVEVRGRRIPVLESPGSKRRTRASWRDLGASCFVWRTGHRNPRAHGARFVPRKSVRASFKKDIPGAPARCTEPRPGFGRRVNGLPEGAKLRSGRAGRIPASPANNEPVGSDSPTSRSRGIAVPVFIVASPGPPVSAGVEGPRLEGWRREESDPRRSWFAALAAVEREPARKKRPAKVGTALREGKARGKLSRARAA